VIVLHNIAIRLAAHYVISLYSIVIQILQSRVRMTALARPPRLCIAELETRQTSCQASDLEDKHQQYHGDVATTEDERVLAKSNLKAQLSSAHLGTLNTLVTTACTTATPSRYLQALSRCLDLISQHVLSTSVQPSIRRVKYPSVDQRDTKSEWNRCQWTQTQWRYFLEILCFLSSC